MDENNDIGRRIRERLNAIGMTQKQLAGKVKIAPDTLNRYINGNRNPKVTTATKIANAMGIRIEELLSDDKTSEDVEIGQETNEANDEMTDGTKFKIARIKAGLTQKELAKKIGCTWQNVSRVERTKHLNYSTKIKFSKALDRPLESIWPVDDEHIGNSGAGSESPPKEKLDTMLLNLFYQFSDRGKKDILMHIVITMDAENMAREKPDESETIKLVKEFPEILMR